MRPSSIIYNNFNTYEWLDYQLSTQFNGGEGARNISKPAVSEFYAVAGAKKQCKSVGLTGAEKRACAQSIKQTCGKKPKGFLGIKGAKKRAKQAEWEKCAQGIAISPEQAAQEAADKLVPTREDEEGLSTGEKVAIAVGVAGFLALVGFAISNKRKSKMVMAKNPIMPRA